MQTSSPPKDKQARYIKTIKKELAQLSEFFIFIFYCECEQNRKIAIFYLQLQIKKLMSLWELRTEAV